MVSIGVYKHMFAKIAEGSLVQAEGQMLNWLRRYGKTMSFINKHSGSWE